MHCRARVWSDSNGRLRPRARHAPHDPMIARSGAASLHNAVCLARTRCMMKTTQDWAGSSPSIRLINTTTDKWNRNQVASLPVKSPAPSPMRARCVSLLFAPSYSHRRLLTTGLQQVLSLLFDIDQPTLPPIVNPHACLRLSPSGIHFDVLSSPVLYTTYIPCPLLDLRVVSFS